MTCYHPIKAWRTSIGIVFSEAACRGDELGRLELSCGRCQGCRARRARDWQIRCVHEAQCWPENCFLTLTYADENLPANGSLDHADFVVFIKRLREQRRAVCPLVAEHKGLWCGRCGVRFFMCGEYGPQTLRPHYHALLFNCDFRDRKAAGKSGSGFMFYTSAELSALWRLGHATVQDMSSETAGYCCSYVFSKVTGDLAEAHYGARKPEYCACSLKPGIGAFWFSVYGADKSRQDFVVHEGRETSPPKYYDKLSDRAGFEWLEEIAWAREKRAKLAFDDESVDRLAVREQVHAARVANRKRDSI